MPNLRQLSAFLSGAICALAISEGNAFAQQRTTVQSIDFPPGYETRMVLAELAPGSCTGRHTHPGIESAYVLEGEVVAKFDNKPDLHRKAGEPLYFAAEEVHNVCNVGSGRFKALAHYIVKKGEPLVTPAP